MLIKTGNDRRFSPRSPQTRFSHFLHTQTEKPPLRFSLLKLGPRASALGPTYEYKSPSPANTVLFGGRQPGRGG